MPQTVTVKRRWATLKDAATTQLWPVPALGVVVAVILGVGLTRVDRRIDTQLPATLADYLFTGEADAARAVLSTIAGSLITVTSLTFSLTVVTLQLASSQYSPRLLRTFSRDRFVHVTLAVLLSTFVYTLTVLRTVHDRGDGDVFVPQISITVAYLLTLCSVVALVLFLAHLAREIRIETMLRNVHSEAEETAAVMLADRTTSDPGPEIPHPPATAWLVMAHESGFLTSVEEDQLLKAAVDTDAVLQLDPMPGSLLVAGTPLAYAWARSGELLSETQFTAISSHIRKAVKIGFERTSAQDIGFALRQLTDVANKALSPGINDPTTAIHALGHSSSLLCRLTGYQLGACTLADGDGNVRVVLRRPALSDLLELAVEQPRRYGANDPNVLAALFDLLKNVAWHVTLAPHQDAVAVQLRRLQATVDRQDFDADERDRLAAMADDVGRVLQGTWRPSLSHREPGNFSSR